MSVRQQAAEGVPAGTTVHIIAIGGVMMSAIARLLQAHGCRISGSDLNASDYTAALAAEGVTVQTGPHRAEHLPPETALVLVSSAIREDNPEVIEARRRGLPILTRAEILGRFVNPRRGLAVAGTHGKTTTSGLAAVLLTEARLEPSFLVGSLVTNYGVNGRAGAGDWVVVEADEYDRAFLSLQPEVAMVTNIEHDHPDIYRDFDELMATFQQFARQVKPHGCLLLGADCPHAPSLAASAGCRVETYGLAAGSDWLALDGPRDGRAEFRLRAPDGREVEVRTKLFGWHNVLNAAGAIAAAVAAGVPLAEAAELAGRCQGTARRFELLAEAGGIRVIDDYAHHPTEVAATVTAAAALGGRLRVIFEPHQYARTRALLDDYRGVFAGADEALVTDIHVARETDLSGVDAARVAAVAGATYAGSADDAFDRLTSEAGADQTWLVMGAGDITQTAHRLANWVRQR